MNLSQSATKLRAQIEQFLGKLHNDLTHAKATFGISDGLWNYDTPECPPKRGGAQP